MGVLGESMEGPWGVHGAMGVHGESMGGLWVHTESMGCPWELHEVHGGPWGGLWEVIEGSILIMDSPWEVQDQWGVHGMSIWPTRGCMGSMGGPWGVHESMMGDNLNIMDLFCDNLKVERKHFPDKQKEIIYFLMRINHRKHCF